MPAGIDAVFLEPDWPAGLELARALSAREGKTRFVFVCPKCGGAEHSYLTTRRVGKCRACKKQFSVKVGTIFEDSPLGLDKWLPAVCLIANSKNGISSHELGRALGVTQKSTWFMLHRIRLAMQTQNFEKLDGEVEVDETYIGGRARLMNSAQRKRSNVDTGKVGKAVVAGAVQRDGSVTASVLEGGRRSLRFWLT